jgi:hypothetical protein
VDLISDTVAYATKVDELVSMQLTDHALEDAWVDSALQVVRTLTEVRVSCEDVGHGLDTWL